jgi:hypothetical protein
MFRRTEDEAEISKTSENLAISNVHLSVHVGKHYILPTNLSLAMVYKLIAASCDQFSNHN